MSTPGADERIEVVAVVASAGGLEALTTVLRMLPENFPAAVVVGQHLGSHGSRLVELLARQISLEVAWAQEGRPVTAGTVTVCPPRKVLEILPDRTCALRDSGQTFRERPLDQLLSSLANSLGGAAVATVLTGMGKDASEGAWAMHRAGGRVVVQSPESAEHSGMPDAVIATGAADLVLTLHDIGPALTQLVRGEVLPRSQAETAAIRALFGTGTGIGALAEAVDWSRTPVGPVLSWPPLMRTVVRLTMDFPGPAAVLWGPDQLNFFNEAALEVVQERAAATFGRDYLEGFPEAGKTLGSQLEDPGRPDGPGRRLQRYQYSRDGRLMHVWLDLSSTPVRDLDESLIAVQVTAVERTSEVLAARRLAVLNRLTGLPSALSRVAAIEQGMAVLRDAEDLTFAVAYLRAGPQRWAELVAAAGVEEDGPMAPRVLTGDGAWPWAQVLEHGQSVEIDRLRSYFPDHSLPGDRALVLPLNEQGVDEVIGLLVLGVEEGVPWDEGYRDFLASVARTLTAKVSDAGARAREREQAERLIELDRLKMQFFANVSHEFRTPLTLMLGPLEEMLQAADPAVFRAELELVARNARRLHRLVGSLLDFSGAEAQQARVRLAPTDLAGLTAQVADQFQTAAGQAGLLLQVQTPALPAPVWVDPQMWEKIVSNLLSNALKFTFEGRIEVRLRALPKHAELVVRDTGVGIPADDLPLVFKRFHRVRDVRGRTQEGTGIGLALVEELVRRHQGRVRVTSTLGEGSAFTVWIPVGRRIDSQPGQAPGVLAETSVAAAMAEEAERWNGRAEFWDSAEAVEYAAPHARVLVVDGNQDVREYLVHLLRPHWEVDTVRDGDAALEQLLRKRPDLVLADVMMPGPDGFALLRRIREDPELATIPVVLLTAREGEEAAVEGLLVGADDYVVKPFGAREIVARIAAQLELARLRRQDTEHARFLLDLKNALRPLTDPADIIQTASRLLAAQLGLDRVAYGQVTPDGQGLVVERDHAAAGKASLTGTFRFADLFLPAENLARGITFSSDDVPHDDRFGESGKAAFAAMGSASICSVPLIKEGRWVANLNLHHAAPHIWTPEEMSLAEEVAERTWADVERARAEGHDL